MFSCITFSYLTVPKIGFMYTQTWNYETVSPRYQYLHSCTVSVSDLYIPRIGPPIWLQQNRQIDPKNIWIGKRYMNVEAAETLENFRNILVQRIFSILWNVFFWSDLYRSMHRMYAVYWSRIHEWTISLRFPGIILGVLRFEVSVHKIYIAM